MITMSEDDTQAPVMQDPVMDTPAPTDTSETNQLATTDAPQATQGTDAAQETATAEIEATDTAQEKLLAGKYKTVDDLEKSYKELESKYGREASEKAELTRILNESFQAPTPAPVEVETAPVYDEYDSNPLTKEIDNLKRVTAVQSFVMGHQDADPVAMQKVLSTDPIINQISGHEAKLEYAYLRSQSMTRPKAIAEAQKAAQVQAQAKIAEKQVAQVEASSKATEADNAALLTQATTASPTDREAARLALIRKHLTRL